MPRREVIFKTTFPVALWMLAAIFDSNGVGAGVCEMEPERILIAILSPPPSTSDAG